MTESTFFSIVWIWLALAAVTFFLLFFVAVPYGRHARRGWGPTINPRWGWMIMESPSALVFGYWFFSGFSGILDASIAFVLLWEAHYLYRAFVYPVRIRGREKRMPVLVMILAMGFNSVNATINGRYLFHFSGGYTMDWLSDPRFIIGALLFIVGFMMNHRSDEILLRLRRKGESKYAIPHGAFYTYVSCPNYLGEIIEWLGWALATWSVAGLSFAVWSIANLVPRARSHHRWYLDKFPDYPKDRKILIPKIW